jgi:hypothetical protein
LSRTQGRPGLGADDRLTPVQHRPAPAKHLDRVAQRPDRIERIAELFLEPILHDKGLFRLSDRPGLGLTLNEAVFEGLLP